MAVSIFYLKKLEKDILSSDITFLDPLLIKEFQKAINSVSIDTWNIYEPLFIKNISYVYSIDEIMVYTILSMKMGLYFLEKNPEYTSELVTSLLEEEKSPLNYVKYATIFLSDEVSNNIINIVNNTNTFSYRDLIRIILRNNDVNMSLSDYNSLIKALYKIQNKEYYLLLKRDDSIKIMYYKIINFMNKENEKQLYFTNSDYEVISTLLSLDSIDVRNDLLRLDINNNTPRKIVREIINYLNKFNKRRLIRWQK